MGKLPFGHDNVLFSPPCSNKPNCPFHYTASSTSGQPLGSFPHGGNVQLISIDTLGERWSARISTRTSTSLMLECGYCRTNMANPLVNTPSLTPPFIPSLTLRSMAAGPVFPLSGENLLQQTLRLTATCTVFGLVVYTGNESKYGLNRGKPPSKVGNFFFQQ